MSNNLIKDLWLIGTGPMSIEYCKVLKARKIDFQVIGRGQKSAKSFYDITEINPSVGGVENFLSKNPIKCSHAIVSVGVEELSSVTCKLIDYGIENILVEKPAGLNITQINTILEKALENQSKVFVAYNRRFYSSVIKAKEIICNDGGLLSFNFEFTEWSHEIEKLKKKKGIKESWFLGNSTHVVDLSFYLGGSPKKISTYSSGSLKWHPSSSIFSGSGISSKNALFTYNANWQSPGRWSVEFLTKKHRLILKPLEKLQIQEIGSIEIENFENIDYSMDESYKAGLYYMIKSFLGSTENLCTIKEHSDNCKYYNMIANYS